MPKPPRLKDHGIDKLFEVAPDPLTPPPLDPFASSQSVAPRTLPPSDRITRWDETHHRRMFYCPDALWTRLEAWCARTGTSRSAALSRALEAFLETQETGGAVFQDGVTVAPTEVGVCLHHDVSVSRPETLLGGP